MIRTLSLLTAALVVYAATHGQDGTNLLVLTADQTAHTIRVAK